MKSLRINNFSRVIPTGNRQMSPIVQLIHDALNECNGVVSKLNTNSENSDLNIYHFGGFMMLLRRLFTLKGYHVVVFHGTDVHRYRKDLGMINRLKEILNWLSNLLLMASCNEIMVVSNSLYQYIPNIYKLKTSVLFLGTKINTNDLAYTHPDEAPSSLAFVNNNSRGVKNLPLAMEYAKNHGLQLVELGGLPHNKFLNKLVKSRSLIITSFNEGSPNVLKEALVLGVSIVSVDVGDCADLISRFGGQLIDYNGNLVQSYPGQIDSYQTEYLSIKRTVGYIKNILA